MNPKEVPLWEAIDDIRGTDGRYAREAYGFVIAALGATLQALPRERLEDTERRHLSGGELLRGVVALARREFGPLAPVVFREWRVDGNEDVGRIVFQLVASGQLSARPEDTIDDFLLAGLDLHTALSAPDDRFGRAPARRRSAGAEGPESGTAA